VPEFVTEMELTALLTVSDSAGLTAGDAVLDSLPELVTISVSEVLAFRFVVVVGAVLVEMTVSAAKAVQGTLNAAIDTTSAARLTAYFQLNITPPTERVF
jgi:hypothetical protein